MYADGNYHTVAAKFDGAITPFNVSVTDVYCEFLLEWPHVLVLFSIGKAAMSIEIRSIGIIMKFCGLCMLFY